MTTAFNIFVRQSLREGGIPFEVRLEQPNKETIAAMPVSYTHLICETFQSSQLHKCLLLHKLNIVCNYIHDVSHIYPCLLYTSRCV